MKTKLLLLVSCFFCLVSLNAQVPQGFNYQAIARDGAGNTLQDADLQVMLYIQSSSTGGTVFWKELHNPVTTNDYGLFSLVLGTGARQTGSTVATFDLIDWKVSPKYLKTEILYAGSWRNMGDATQLYSVPYAMTARDLEGTDKLNIKGTTSDLEEALFEVKNKNAQTIFAVYNEGVRIWVDDGAKGSKGGFAVGGFDQTQTNQEYLRVTKDSTRVYVNNNPAKGQKGGFAVGGFDQTKATPILFTSLTPQNYFIGHESGLKTDSKNGGLYNSFFGYQTGKLNTTGSNNLFLGFYSGYSNSIGRDNVFIGTNSGYNNSTGYNNVMLGYQSGYYNTSGIYNSFLGHQAGFWNSTGGFNTCIGYQAGFYNATGQYNTYLGLSSGFNSGYNTTADPSYNTFIGYQTGANNQTGDKNTYIGFQAGFSSASLGTGSNNVSLGIQTGYNNLSGYNNIFMGNLAGYTNTTGHDNVCIGNNAGYTNSVGNYNIFVGTEAGKMSNADYNTFMGYMAGSKTSSGGFNAIVGYAAGYANTTGVNNSYFGYCAGYANTGTHNTFIGAESGAFEGAGHHNVFVGTSTGRNNTGNYNVFLGYGAGYSESGSNKLVIHNNYSFGDDYETISLIYGEFDNKKLRFNGSVGVNTDPASAKLCVVDDSKAIAIRGETTWSGSSDHYGVFGYSAGSTQFNHGVYGSAYGGSQAFGVWGTSSGASSYNVGLYGSASGTNAYGVYGSASGAGAYAGYFYGNVYVNGTITQTSDKRLKKNIIPLSGSLHKILGLQGVSFEWKSGTDPEKSNPSKNSVRKPGDISQFNFPEGAQVGMIAQDVEKVLPELVITDPDGLKSVDYIKMVPLLIESIKEQQKQIDQLSNIIIEMRSEIASLRSQ